MRLEIQEVISNADLPQIVDVGNIAFRNDAASKACFPIRLPDGNMHPHVNKWRCEVLGKFLKAPNNHILKVVDLDNSDGNNIAAISYWEGPQEKVDGMTAAEKAKKDQYDEEFPEGVDKDVRKKIGDAVDAAKKNYFGENENGTDFWHLAVLATSEKYVGNGAAAMLLRWGIEMADKENVLVHLESTPMAVGFYERFGFTKAYTVPLLDCGYNFQGMIRQPKKLANGHI